MSEAGVMLGFAGLVGALLLGVVAEAATSWASKGDEDDSDGAEHDGPGTAMAQGLPDDAPETGDAGDLMDWAGAQDGDPPMAEGVAGAVATDLPLSEVTEGDDLARIDDFDAETDHLVVVYDPELHPDPALTLEPTPDGSGMTVMLDGVPLAEVPGATDLRPEQVRLKPSMPLAA